jgi:hypothetical protein
VALQADEASARGRRPRTGQLGLADARLAFEQQRLLERDRQVQDRRYLAAGEISLAGERGGDGA